jgi:hypothetical protein
MGKGELASKIAKDEIFKGEKWNREGKKPKNRDFTPDLE